MRKNHDLPSFVAFFDPVKAYDTANHDLCFKVLKQYGAPPKFCSAIRRTYKDPTVVLKLGKNIEEIMQEVGVRQGNNMVPVLVLFLMSAFAESLELIWEENGLKFIKLKRTSDGDFEEGNEVIKGHTHLQLKLI